MLLVLKFGNQRWNDVVGMCWVREYDDAANFVHDPNMNLGSRVHSVAEKAMLARQWKERMEALVDLHQFGGRF